MLTTEWNYTELADAYLKRAEYSSAALDRLVQTAGVLAGAQVCDIGAGTGNLTVPLARRGLRVSAVEPNDAMRAHGIRRTRLMESVRWSEGTGEATGQPTGEFDLVTFGSSFNVTDRPKALHETCRLLKPRAWFACLWNHRDLEDPLQKAIESYISSQIPAYGYGTRREDQTALIDESGLFETVQTLEGRLLHTQTAEDCIEAWRSHATLHRQAGAAFPSVISGIERIVRQAGSKVEVAYVTRIWMARKAATA